MENRKKMYENFIREYILSTETDELIQFPHPWKLENNNFSFYIYVSVINRFSSGKQIRIYAEFLNYNDANTNDLYCESLITSNFYPKKEINNDKIINDIVDTMINFRTKFRFSKIFDKFVKKDDSSDIEENRNFFFFKEADPYKDSSCCVCSDECLTFTRCGHNLCRVCFSCIEIDTDFNNIWKKCPICREVLKCSDNEIHEDE